MARTTINLNHSLHKKLGLLAQTENRTLTNLIETLLLRQVEKGEEAAVAKPPPLAEIVKRIVATAHPQKIILFGSAAEGTMGPHSDLDFLVIIPPGLHRRRMAQKIYQNLIGVGFAADVVVVTQEDVENMKDNPGMVIAPALKEGKVLYAA